MIVLCLDRDKADFYVMCVWLQALEAIPHNLRSMYLHAYQASRSIRLAH